MVESCYLDGLQIHETGTFSLVEFGLGSPSPRTASDDRPFAHGAVDETRYYGPRIVPVRGEVWGSDFAAFWQAVDDLKGACRLSRDGSLKVLKFRRAGLSFDERMLVRVASTVDVVPPPGGSTFSEFGFELFAPDPRIYSDTLTTASYDPTTTGSGGLGFPLDFPIVFIGDGSSTLAAVNDGNIDTPPVFTITGPVVNPIIDNEMTGESITTKSLSLSAGEVMEIDVGARVARLLPGGTSRPDLIDSSLTTWFELAPGTNSIRMRGTGMSSGSTLLAVAHRAARI